MTPISFAGLRPQARHVKLSRRRNLKRSRIEGFRRVRFFRLITIASGLEEGFGPHLGLPLRFDQPTRFDVRLSEGRRHLTFSCLGRSRAGRPILSHLLGKGGNENHPPISSQSMSHIGTPQVTFVPSESRISLRAIRWLVYTFTEDRGFVRPHLAAQAAMPTAL